MIGFGDRLRAAMDDRLPLCVGIDPHPSLLAAWGLADDIEGLRKFARHASQELAPHAAVIKPQSAFFERHGSMGVAVLEETIGLCRAEGALVILDAKRGDIGSTAAAYADAYLRDGSPLRADALTISPYLGFGSLQPFFDAAATSNAGLFVLARTSNPEGAEVQQATTADGRSVAQLMIDHAAERNRGEITAGAALGSVGVVVGATVRPGAVDLARLGGAVLAPGLGAQGAGPEDLRAALASAPLTLASTSRDVLRAGPAAGAILARAREVAATLR